MKKLMSLAAAVCCVGLMTGTLRVTAEEAEGTAAKKKEAMTQCVFVCPDCHAMALKDGKCAKCEKEMKKMHLLGVKDSDALLCACGETCTCTAAGMKDEKCSCGKMVKKMSVKGMYVCPDGCPDIADKPGKCACGKEMKKVE